MGGPGAVAVGIVHIILPRRRKGPAHRGTDGMDRAQGIDPNLTMERDASRGGSRGALHCHPMRRDLHGHFTGDPVWFPVGRFAPVKGGPKEGATGPTGDAGIEPKSPRRGRSRFHVDGAGCRIPKARSLDLGKCLMRAAVPRGESLPFGDQFMPRKRFSMGNPRVRRTTYHQTPISSFQSSGLARIKSFII